MALSAPTPQSRAARTADAPAISGLLSQYAADGLLLARPLDDIYASLLSFEVVEIAGEIVGCGSLYIYGPLLAEVRSLAVRPSLKRQGIGRRLMAALIRRAESLSIERLFALTYQNAFFSAMGFAVIDKKELPQKIWKDCVGCAHFPECDETAFARLLPVAVAQREVQP